MLFNYIKTAIRSLLRHRFFSAINVFGLAVAMSICMTIMMLVADQMSYDRYNTNAERIYRITTIYRDEKGNILEYNQVNAASCMPVGPALVESYSGVEQAVRLRTGFGNHWLEFESKDVTIPVTGFFADANALEFFQYELEYGDAATALQEPFSLVLTRTAAKKLFKEENPVGLTLQVGDRGLYTVTGVLKETNKKSHIVFEGLASMASVTSLEQDGKLGKISNDWTAFWQGWTYIKVQEGKSKGDVQDQLDRIYNASIASIPNPAIQKMSFSLQPLLEITPGAVLNNAIGPQMPWEIVYFLGGLALVILVTSCFNFTNLSIARSLTRAREIGVRKVAGAARWQIFTQFISESVVVAFAALVIAIVLLIIIKPMLLQLNFAQMFRWDLSSSTNIYLIFIAFTLVVGIMAGLFPAVVLSAFKPVIVLKSLGNVKLFSRMGMRKVLLVAQFTLSLFFIVTVIVIYNQLNLFTHQEHGFNIKNNVMVKLNGASYQSLKTELQKYSNITAISAVSHIPAAGTSNGAGLKRNVTDTEGINANYFQVDEDYVSNMQLNLLAGKFFTESQGESNKNFVVMNEAAMKKLNFDSPQEAIGQTIIYANDSTTKTILGVVENYNHRHLMDEITPAILLYDPGAFNVLQVAYSGSFEHASRSIEKAWATVNPGVKIDYTPVESEINKYYEVIFGDLMKVLGFISFLAILISCLGLLGMATYATETRIKEISIRKVLGSSGSSLIFLLSKGFLKMLAISVMIGIPLSYLTNTFWLEQIAYHTTIGPGIISISILVLVFFGIITIGSQTVRATFVNPADNLKNE